jgi:hypothetical protein
MKQSELLYRLNQVLKAITWWPNDNLAKEITSCKVTYEETSDNHNMDFEFICEKGNEDYLNCQIVSDNQGHYSLYYEAYHYYVVFTLKDLISLGYENESVLLTNYHTSSAVKYPGSSTIWYSMNKERWEQDMFPGSVKRSKS